MLDSLVITLAALAAVVWLLVGAVVVAVCRMAAKADDALRATTLPGDVATEIALLEPHASQALPREYVADRPH